MSGQNYVTPGYNMYLERKTHMNTQCQTFLPLLLQSAVSAPHTSSLYTSKKFLSSKYRKKVHHTFFYAHFFQNPYLNTVQKKYQHHFDTNGISVSNSHTDKCHAI